MSELRRSLKHFKLLSKARPELLSARVGGEAVSIDHCQLDQMRLMIIECFASLKHVEDELMKQPGGLFELQKAESKVFWLGLCEVGKEGHRNAIEPAPEEGYEKRHTACSKLLDAFPDPAKATNDQGPLYLGWCAISDGIEVQDVRLIANTNRELVKKSIFGNNGMNVCQLAAMKRKPNVQIIRQLEEYFPFFSFAAASRGWLPIHFAARYSDDEHMIEYLLQCDPSSTKKLTSDNETPLHLACSSKSQGANQVFDALFEVDSDPVQMITSGGYTPLHIACQGDLIEPGHVVATLLAKHKEAAAVAQPDGCLAVHDAARHSTKEVLEMVVKANMEGVKVVAGVYGTAMHQAASGKNVANVEYLHSLSPALIAIKDIDGSPPLHAAASCSNFAMLRAVFACDPLAVRVADNDGDLALYYLMYRSNKLTFEPLSDEAKSLRFLLKAYPQGASHANNDGDTPYSLCLPARAYARRLLLMAAPALDPAELHRVNYEARRQVLFLAFGAVTDTGLPNIIRRIRQNPLGTINVVRSIASFI